MPIYPMFCPECGLETEVQTTVDNRYKEKCPGCGTRMKVHMGKCSGNWNPCEGMVSYEDRIARPLHLQ